MDTDLSKKRLADLALALADLAYPEMELRENPKTGVRFNSVSCITYLTDPVYHLCVMIEGAKHGNGLVQIAPCPTWIEQRAAKDGSTTLFLKRGIWLFHERCFVDTYDPPRRITYFANFCTFPSSGGLTNGGVQLEKGLVIPRSSSSQLEAFVNNKLLTRLLLARAGVAVPATLAFTHKSVLNYEQSVGGTTVAQIVPVHEDAACPEFFRKHLLQFLKTTKSQRIVIKPSGPMWMESRLVTFHLRHETDKMVATVQDVYNQLYDGDSILVEVFITTAPTHHVFTAREFKLQAALSSQVASTMAEDGATVLVEEQEAVEEEKEIATFVGEKNDVSELSARVRVVVMRVPRGAPVVSKIVCGINRSSGPVNGDNTIPISLDGMLDQWGMRSSKFKATLVEAIHAEARETLNAIIAFENGLEPDARGGASAQTDCIGIDFVISTTDKVLLPVVIEVNDHDCTFQAQMLEFMLPETMGETVRPWIINAVSRSQCYLVANRTLLLIGAGGYSKRFVFDCARTLGVRLVVVDSDVNHPFREMCDLFVPMSEIIDHVNDKQNAESICARLEQLGVKPDGVLTFWEDCGPLSAFVSQMLGLKGNSPEAQMRAKNKAVTQATLRHADTHELPHRVPPHMFAVKQMTVDTEEELERALEEMPLPAVLKLAHGSSACGVLLVSTKKEARKEWTLCKRAFTSEHVHPGIGLGFGNQMLLAEYVEGSEHDVDIVMTDGELQAAFISDNGPTRLPLFCESSATMPSTLHKDKQAALVACAIQCCRALGLHTGVFNVEVKMTPLGPKLIEVNARMGGFYLRDWIVRLYGVDICQAAMLVALDVSPMIPRTCESRGVMMGRQIYSSSHGHVRLDQLAELHQDGLIVLNQFEERMPDVEKFEEPFANLAVRADSHAMARAELQMVWRSLRLDRNDLPCSWYTQNFE